MNARSSKIIQAVVLLGTAALWATGCAPHGQVSATEMTPAESSDPNSVRIADPQRFPVIQATMHREPEVLSANGVVTPDVARTVHINAMAGGQALEVRARLGEDVRKGQVLVVVHSPELESAIQQYEKDQSDEHLARSTLDRIQDLYGHGAAALQELQAAQNQEQKAQVDVKTDADRIRLLGGDLQHLSPTIEVRSPISGAVVDQAVADGDAVKSPDNSQSLFMVADLSRVWVLCDVYENDLAKVSVGDAAEIRLDAYPDRAFHGSVGNISQVLDPSSRTAKVRVELANVGGIFRPQMFARVRLVSRRTYARLLLPSTAVLRLHDKDWVFVRTDSHTFRRTEVQAGTADGNGMQAILGGLSAGAPVVSNALQFSSAAAAQ